MRKRLISFLICLCLLLPIMGCSLFSEGIQEPVQFYYLQKDYLYGQENAVICAEERDGTGHIKDLEYLLQLYLLGPHNEELVSPFPPGLQIKNIFRSSDGLRIALSDSKGLLSDLPEARQTVVFSCLALTCFDITGASAITLVWEKGDLTMTRDTLTLFDSSAHPESQ